MYGKGRGWRKIDGSGDVIVNFFLGIKDYGKITTIVVGSIGGCVGAGGGGVDVGGVGAGSGGVCAASGGGGTSCCGGWSNGCVSIAIVILVGAELSF